MSETKSHPHVLALAAGIVSAHLSHNALPAEALPDLIQTVYVALSRVSTASVLVPAVAKPEPAVAVKKSIFPDYLVCLEDGKKLKMLKRHLMRSYGMTPQEYREKWGLPDTYPMVAPDYAARRSALAKEIGLGRKAAPLPNAEVPVQRIPAGVSGKRGPGRPRKMVA